MKRFLLAAAICLISGALWGEPAPFGDSTVGISNISTTENGTVGVVVPPAPQDPGADSSPLILLPQKPAIPAKTLDRVFAELNDNERAVSARVRYIPQNDVAWYVRWKMLRDAKATIDCTYYIVDKDVFGQSFLGLLARKAREGLKIRLMIDGRIYRSGYMKGMPDRFKALSVFPNVQVKVYNSISQSLLHAFTDFGGLFASSHKKILISDGNYSLTGGRNIGPDYFAGSEEYPVVYRDTDILVEGSHAAERFKAAFEDEWAGLRNSDVKPPKKKILQRELDRIEIAARVMERYLNDGGLVDPATSRYNVEQKKVLAELNGEISRFKNISSYAGFELFTNEPELPVKILEKNSSLGKLNEIAPCLKAFANAAREEIIIQNPYVVLSDEAMDALRRASARGVKIIIHSNSGGSTDSLFPQAFLMNDWKRMLAEMPTLRILVAPGALQRLHSKTFIADRHIVIVGSYNMDPLSKNSNAEAVAVVNDKDFAKETYDQTQMDIARGVLEYKIKRDARGKPILDKKGQPISEYGPEDHLNASTIRKMNFFRRLGWIRPVI